uniref:Uncharacterized protein n=1 Tax=Arundo donax TaxID=35708 RepID=A0A0A9GZ27_ARUDO
MIFRIIMSVGNESLLRPGMVIQPRNLFYQSSIPRAMMFLSHVSLFSIALSIWLKPSQ